MRRKRRKRRRLKRLMRHELEKEMQKGEEGSAVSIASITEALGNNRILNEILDQVDDERKRKRFDGSFIKFLLSLDWDRILEIIRKVLGLFGRTSFIRSQELQKVA